MKINMFPVIMPTPFHGKIFFSVFIALFTIFSSVTAASVATTLTSFDMLAMGVPEGVRIGGSPPINSEEAFSFMSPGIAGFVPTEAGPTTVIVITGTGFSSTLANNEVAFGNDNYITAFNVNEDNTEIKVTVPGDAVSGKVKVRVNGVVATSNDNFTYLAPQIFDFQPRSAAIGDTITITGHNFLPTSNGHFVAFGNDIFTLSLFDLNSERTEIKARVSAVAESGTLKVRIGTDGVFFRPAILPFSEPFTLIETDITVTDFNPKVAHQNQTIIITGSGFSPHATDNEVSFGGGLFVNSFEVNENRTEITVGVPNYARNGKVIVRVGSTMKTSVADFEYLVPAITDFQPGEGTVGDVITITGENFFSSAAASANQIRFGSRGGLTEAFEVNEEGTQLKVQVPGNAESGRLYFAISFGTGSFGFSVGTDPVESGAAFTFVPAAAPTITGFMPTSGRLGDEITITGSNFSSIASNNQVAFGNDTFLSLSPPAEVNDQGTQLKVRLRPQAASGKVKARIGDDGMIATSVEDFTFTMPAAFTVTDFSPKSARVGDTLTITGTGFSFYAPFNFVRFGGRNPKAIEVNDDATQIKVIVPEGARSDNLVVIRDSRSLFGGPDRIITDEIFTLLPLFAVTDIMPAEGAVGTEVTITGTGFSPAPADNEVAFGSDVFVVATTVLAMVPTNPDTLIVSVPAGAQTGTIRAKTSDGAVVMSTAIFTVPGTVAPLSINSFSPAGGAVGTEVTITGTGFSPTLADNEVAFGNDVFVVATTVRAMVPTDLDTLIVSVPAGTQTGTIRAKVKDDLPIESVKMFTIIPPPLSVHDWSEGRLHLYPNPASERFNIAHLPPGDYTYAVFALSGKRVLSGTLHDNDFLDIRSLNPGTYVVKVKTRTFSGRGKEVLLQRLLVR